MNNELVKWMRAVALYWKHEIASTDLPLPKPYTNHAEAMEAAAALVEAAEADARRYRIGGHGNCINDAGYELGMAWVKHDKHGQLENAL